MISITIKLPIKSRLLITIELTKLTAVIGGPNGILWGRNYIPSTDKDESKNIALSVSLDDIPEVNDLEHKSSYLIVTSTVDKPSSKPDIDGDIIFFTARVGLCKDKDFIYIESGKGASSYYYIIPANVHTTLSYEKFLELLQRSESLTPTDPIPIDSIKLVINE